MHAEKRKFAEGLPDGSVKPGEGMCDGLCRTCSEQPEQKLTKAFRLTAPDHYRQ
jgi:hypothetical protein